MIPINFQKIDIQKIKAEWLDNKEIALDVLRLDKIHPIISGNKSFKLAHYIGDCIEKHKTTIATFGGTWSNHIVATAYASKIAGLQSIGIIRGDRTTALSSTLIAAKTYGMKLFFVSRNEYRNKELTKEKYANDDWYWINEGGYGSLGAKGASEILATISSEKYSHIIAAVGSGTMLAGLTQSITNAQRVIGISSMKGNTNLHEEVKRLIVNIEKRESFDIIDDYHFGGFGKHPKLLIDFMNETYLEHGLPLDIVYTGKTFFAVKNLIEKDFFPKGSQLLIIHSGGLQGNMSLGDNFLTF